MQWSYRSQPALCRRAIFSNRDDAFLGSVRGEWRNLQRGVGRAAVSHVEERRGRNPCLGDHTAGSKQRVRGQTRPWHPDGGRHGGAGVDGGWAEGGVDLRGEVFLFWYAPSWTVGVQVNTDPIRSVSECTKYTGIRIDDLKLFVLMMST